MRRLLAAALLAAPLPANAGYSGSIPGGGSVVMGGDASGTSDNMTVKKLNGATPGGSCPAGYIPNGITSTGAPTNCLATALGFTYRSGNWYMDMRSGGTFTAQTANLLACAPFILWGTVTPSYLGVQIKTAATSGSYLSIALYANGSNERPTGTPLLSINGLTSTATSGRIGGSVSGQALAGFTKYWQCAWSDGNPAIGTTGISNSMMQVYGDTDDRDEQINSSFGLIGYSYSTTYSSTAFPDLTSVTMTKVTAGTLPALKFQP